MLTYFLIRIYLQIAIKLALQFSFFLQVGSDIPGISSDLICEGFKLIEDEKSDIILGPAIDGGYYTIGASARAGASIS